MSAAPVDACSTAEDFVHLFYDRLDTKRHALAKLYLDNATLAWNGNKVEGASAIQQFYLDRIPSTEHELTSLDAQMVLSSAVGGQQTIIVQASGSVRFQEKRSKPFQHNFMVTATQEAKWKVATEVFRSQEPSSTSASAS